MSSSAFFTVFGYRSDAQSATRSASEKKIIALDRKSTRRESTFDGPLEESSEPSRFIVISLVQLSCGPSSFADAFLDALLEAVNQSFFIKTKMFSLLCNPNEIGKSLKVSPGRLPTQPNYFDAGERILVINSPSICQPHCLPNKRKRREVFLAR